jgi:serine/threonine protein kinase
MVDLTYMTQGSNSIIYSAVWQNRPVVIKVIQEAKIRDIVAIHEFDIEFELLSRIDHPNVVSVLGCGTVPRPFIVLEKLQCVANMLDLDAANSLPSIFRKRVFSYSEILELAKSLSDALHYLHCELHPGATLIHRDLKPENLGLAADGTLKLFDFGLSRCVRATASAHDKYKMTGNTGSLRFMAPEVALGQPYNEKVDVYSYAIVIWTLARNKMAFRGYNRQMHRNLVVVGGERPKLERNWPSDFSALLERCWHADSSKRPSFAEVSRLLSGMISPSSTRSGGHGRSSQGQGGKLLQRSGSLSSKSFLGMFK